MSLSELTETEVTTRLCQQTEQVHLVALVTRVAVTAFMAAIQWYWYPPNSSRNRQFEIFRTKWSDQHWLVTSFPNTRLIAARRLAKQLGLRVASGPPAIIAGQIQITLRPSQLPKFRQSLNQSDMSVRFFPGAILPSGKDNPAVLAIENATHSPIYKNCLRDHMDMLAASDEINTILNRGVSLTPTEIADYIYGSEAPKET